MPSRGRSHRSALFAAVLLLFAAAGLCAFQFGDRYGMNSMPYAQVQALVSDLPKAEKMASEGNIELLAGQTLEGKPVHLRGEITDANCFIGKHTHAYDHAFCAKLCAAAGSPLVFIPDQGAQTYVVLTPRNSVRLPNSVLDQIGIPGIVVNGKSLEAGGLAALAVDSIGK